MINAGDVREVIRKVENEYREEGRAEGRKKGFEEGTATALPDITIQLLKVKFGEMPNDIKKGISESDTLILKLLLSNIFRYECVDDVRRYIE